MLYLDIKKSFGSFKLNIKLEAKDETLALLGGSGCGKSMTLRCIAGIEKPDEGVIILNGRTLFDSKNHINLPPQKRRTGLLFQNYALFPNMTVRENILVGIKKSRQEKLELSDRLMKKFLIDELADRFPSQLSGGQQQRVALARILASEPEIIMLDEPFSALDSYLRWQLEQELSTILSEFSGTTIFVSHNRDEVYRICDRIAVVSAGSIDTVADKWELFKNPVTYTGALLTGCKNISRAKRLSDSEILAEDWGLTFKTHSADTDINWIGIRGKKISVAIDESKTNGTCFEYEVVREIKDTFTNILLIKKKDCSSDTRLIRWEMSRKQRSELNFEKPFASISDDEVLFLK